MSQSYDDGSDNRQITELRVGIPIAAGMLLIVIGAVEQIHSNGIWTIDRGVRLFCVLAFLTLLAFYWRLIRKDLKVFHGLCCEDGAIQVDPRVYRRFRTLIANLVSLNSSVIILLILAFIAVSKL